MIHTIRTVAVGDQESKIDSPIILYRGDREVEVEFTINGSKFTFTNGGNVIKSTNATHGQLVINTPTGENMFSEVTECHDGKVVFVITKEMIDELIEVGFYSFQIRLFDESQVSRVTIPPVLKGIDIRNPIAAEDETNVVDIGLVDYAVVVKDEFEDLSTFLPDGNYNKTEWESKDVISGAKLNKIEDALYNINSNMEAADLALLNRVENINKTVHGEIDKLGNELEIEVEEFERDLNNNVEMFKIHINDDINEIENRFNDYIVAIPKRSADDIDDTNRLQYAIDNMHKPSTVLISEDYIVSGLRLKSGITLKGNGGTITWKSGVCADPTRSYYFINGMGVDNVTIDNVTFNGNQSSNKEFLVADIITISGENNKILNCTLLDSPDSGIMITGSKNSEIRGNRIDNCRDLGIYVNDGSGENHYENIISHNKITRCVSGGIGCKRITQRTIISSNMIFRCGNGITLEHASTSDDYSKNMTITNNTLRRIGYGYAAAKRGINLRCSHNTIVSNNKIEDCEGHCIMVEGSNWCNITDNIITGSQDASIDSNVGIYVTHRDSYGCNYNVISGNIITDTRKMGIWFNSGVESKFNIIKDNIVSTAYSVAFRTQVSLSESIIQSNIFSGTYDFMDYGAKNCIISNNKYVNKQISSTGTDHRTQTMTSTMLCGNRVCGISYSSSGVPTSGEWVVGDLVYNMSPVVYGDSPDGYFIFGWKRLTSSNTNIVGVDWQEIRIFTDDRVKYEMRLTDIGNPTGVIQPKYIGEEIADTTNKKIYKAFGLNASDWKFVGQYT